MTFDDLFALAKKKDLGLDPFYFAYSVSTVEKIEIWPILKKPIEPTTIKAYFGDLSKKLLEHIKPQ